MIRALLHSPFGQLTLGLTLLSMALMVWRARQERDAPLPLTFWLAPAAALMLVGASVGASQQLRWISLFAGQGSADQFAHGLYVHSIAEPLRMASGGSAVLLTFATGLSSWRREGWRRLTVLATLVALTASAASLYDLLFAFHDGLRSCEVWAAGELKDYLRGQNQIFVARGALVTCAMGATLALAGWALHPTSWPGARDSLGVAACLVLGSAPAAALDLTTQPWLEDTLLARVPVFMGLTENLPPRIEASIGACHVDEVWRWEADQWETVSAPPRTPEPLYVLLALPIGAPAQALLTLPDRPGRRYLGLHDAERTLALDTQLGQLSRLRALELAFAPEGLPVTPDMPVEALVAACAERGDEGPCVLAKP